MMSREVKRVPLNFDWPINEIWVGYLMSPCSDDCEKCKKWATIMEFELSEYGCPTLEFLAPPKGKGWQMWETTSEGSPISPVFETPENLANWLSNNNASAFGDQSATYDQWLAMIKQGWAPSAIADKNGIRSGVENCGDMP